jgi:hypothetical protein
MKTSGKDSDAIMTGDASNNISCRQLFSAGQDGKVRLWESQHSNMSHFPNKKQMK